MAESSLLGNSINLGSDQVLENYCDSCHDTQDEFKPVAGFCLNCDENLCRECYDFHLRPKPFRNHKLVENSTRQKQKPQYKSQQTTEKCPRHHEETLQSYCKTHSQICCNVCLTINHQTCDIDDISKMARNIKDSKDLEDLNKKLSKIKTSFNKNLSKTEANRSTIQSSYLKAKDEMKKLRNEFDRLMTESENQAEIIKEEDLNQNKSVAERSNVIIDQINKITSNLKNLQDKDNNENIFISMKRAENELQFFEESLNKLDQDNTAREYKFEPDVKLINQMSQLKVLGCLCFLPATHTSAPSPDVSISQRMAHAQSQAVSFFQQMAKAPIPAASNAQQMAKAPSPAVSISQQMSKSPSPAVSISQQMAKSPSPAVSISQQTTKAQSPAVSISQQMTKAPSPAVSISQQMAKAPSPADSFSQQMTKTPSLADSISQQMAKAPSPAVSISQQMAKTPTHVKDINVFDKNLSHHGSVVLPNKQILITDFHNDKVKLIDTNKGTIVSEVKVSGGPRNITKVKSDEFAVLLVCKIQILNLSQNVLSTGREISVNGSGFGIAYNDQDQTFVVALFIEGKLVIINMSGTVVRTIETDSKGAKLFGFPHDVALTPDRSGMYVSDDNGSVTLLSLNGDVKAVYEDNGLRFPEGICVHKSGVVYVVGRSSDTVHQIDPNTGEVKLLLDKKDGLDGPYSISYCDVEDKMYVGMYNTSSVKVFEMK